MKLYEDFEYELVSEALCQGRHNLQPFWLRKRTKDHNLYALVTLREWLARRTDWNGLIGEDWFKWSRLVGNWLTRTRNGRMDASDEWPQKRFDVNERRIERNGFVARVSSCLANRSSFSFLSHYFVLVLMLSSLSVSLRFWHPPSAYFPLTLTKRHYE